MPVLLVMVCSLVGMLMLGWLYEGPRRGLKWAACYFGLHRKLRWGVNPVNQNSEPYCQDCGRFPQKMY
jgi:hypothetical protein